MILSTFNNEAASFNDEFYVFFCDIKTPQMFNIICSDLDKRLKTDVVWDEPVVHGTSIDTLKFLLDEGGWKVIRLIKDMYKKNIKTLILTCSCNGQIKFDIVKKNIAILYCSKTLKA